MMRNEFADTMNVRRRRSGSWANAVAILLGLAICLGWAATQAAAQTAGEGAIVGTVKDASGAVIPNAKVTATNNATNIATTRTSSAAGYYAISPLPPGTYSILVTAADFKTLNQENVVLDALQTLAFNPVLAVGASTQTITVTAAPPVLETENATLGMTMENETYSNLPLQMNGNQRDPTAFGVLTPGAQGANNGGRLPIIGGTGSYLGQLYLDGMPAETVSQQGDNRLISLSMNLDAVDQFQLVTSSPPAEYMGAGAENFTMKSGGLKYHGQFSDFVRNTVFDNWGFTAKAATVKNAQGVVSQAPKPIEHQNEMSMSAGGYVPRTGKKLFFFVAYDKFHYRKGASYALYTIPTALMVQGDFTELVGNPGSGQSGTGASNPAFLFDPTSNKCTGSSCSRLPLQGTKPGSGVVSNNVIPANMMSPISKAMQQWMPAPSNPGVLANNYLGGYPGGYDNHATDWRVDYDLSARNRISSVGVMGVENYLNNYGAPLLPLPYTGGDLAAIYPKDYVVGDTFTISPNLVNQLKGSYTRFFQNIHNSTQGNAAWGPTALGMTNIPAGQGGQEFPGASFANTVGFGTALQTWTTNSSSTSTQLTTPNNYAYTDNLQWLKGKHALTFGLTYQFQEINNANPATYSGFLGFAYNALSTANYGATYANGVVTGQSNTLSTGGSGAIGAPGTTAATAGPSGYSYASFLLGAIGGSPSLGLQPVSEEGGRYKTIAPYAEDIFKLTPKLTLDIGIRWDYLPPYHEVQNRWTFLNPSLTNPLTGTPGMLQFAGHYGGAGVSCQCKTPVQTYWKNWGPRVSFAYELNPKTVFRGGFAQVFSQGGGVGGRGGASGGTGQTGFNMSANGATEASTGAAAGPSYYLNNSAAFTTLGLANASLFGSGFVYPSAPTPGVAAQELNTGFYLNSSNKVVSAGSVSYADPYISGRAPEIEMVNAGFERGLTSDMTLAVNYVGTESHFIINSGTNGANARGYWAGQLDPKYLAGLGAVKDSTGKNPLLTSAATAANVAILQANMPGSPALQYFENAAAVSSSATITQMLLAFPQYSVVNDTWGVNVGNFSYQSLQITLNQRTSHGLTFNVNYTFSKNIGDDGSFRSGYNIPAAAMSGTGTTNWKADRIDRSYTDISIPSYLKAFGVYELPFGQGHIGSDSRLVRWAAGGWQFSSIYTIQQGAPILVTWTGCTAAVGQCMPDINPNYAGSSAHINGKWGSGPNGFNTCNLGINAVGQTGCTAIHYLDNTAFQAPQNISTASAAQYLIGNAPRAAAMNLRSPYNWDVDAGLRRTIPIHENVKFVFEADCLNVWNHVTFGSPAAAWTAGSTSFGNITGIQASPGPRDFQFAGHLNF
jgi:hypothetical protein